MGEDQIAALHMQAKQAIAGGKVAHARELYERSVSISDNSPDAHFGLATVLFMLKDLEGAARHFKRVTELDPNRAGAFINLGAVCNRLERLDEAAKALRKGINLDSGRGEGYYNLGLVHRRRNDFDLALDAYKEAVRLSPRMLDAHYNLANLYFEMDRHSMAIKHYKEALDINPQFEKARAGLKKAEAAFQAEVAALAPTENYTVPAALPGGEHSEDELQRVLDPISDGAYLSALHRATIETEKSCKAFLHALEFGVEPSLKNLSAALLYSEKRVALASRLRDFETALRNLLNLQRFVQSGMKKVLKISDHPTAGTPLEPVTS